MIGNTLLKNLSKSLPTSLHPFFFLVFINDLPSCVMSATFGYADDCKIVGDNPLTLNIDVRRLWRWCEENCMAMKLTKSKVLCIKGSATIALLNYSFETTEVMKDLGILITDRLSWTQHAKKGWKSLKRSLRTQKESLKGKFRDQTKRIYLLRCANFVIRFSYLETIKRSLRNHKKCAAESDLVDFHDKQ